MPLPYFFGGQKTYIYWMNQMVDALNALISGSSGVQTVSGWNVDNTDPQNPIIDPPSVDGVTITGDGTPGDPLVAAVPTITPDQGGDALRAQVFG